jgi:DNA-binding beta-propeller fold protein YncE
MRPAGLADGRSQIIAMPALVLSPDGRRAYAIGAGPNNTSTGVWVFDATTLELLDHWQPRAVLNSIAVSADGRFVYVTGAPRFDVDGNQNLSWLASVTVYDASSGEQQLLYGEVASENWVTFPNWH